MTFRWEWWCCATSLLLAPFVAGHFAFAIQPAAGLLSGLTDGAYPEIGYALVGLPILVGIAGATWRNPVFRLPFGRLLFFVSLFWALLLMSGANTVFTGAAGKELLRWSVNLCAFFLVASIAGRGRYALALCAVISLAGSLEAGWAIREYAASVRQIPGWRVFGTLFNPDFLAGYLVLITPLCLTFLAQWRGAGRSLVALLAFLPLPALLLTGSRGGLLAFGMEFAALLLLLRWNRALDRRTGVSLAVAVAAMAALFMGLTSLGASQRLAGGPGESIEHSAAFRKYLWADTLTMIKEQPAFGHGLGSFPWAHGPSAKVGFTRLAHNSYLQLGAEAGVPALIGLLITFGFWIATAIRRERSDQVAGEELCGVSTPAIRAAIVAGVIGADAHNFVDSDAYLLANGLTLWSMMGMGLALAVDGVMPIFLPKAALGAIATTIAAMVGWPLLCQARANHLGAAGAALSETDPFQAAALYAQAASIAPNDRRYLMRAAMYATDRESAIRFAERAVRVEPAAETFNAAARVYEAAKEPKRAEDAFKQALLRDPSSPVAFAGLLDLYETDRPEEALRIAERVAAQRESLYATVRAVPEVVETIYARANLLLGRSGHDPALLRLAFDDYDRFMNITYPLVIARANYSPVPRDQAEEIVDRYFLCARLLGPEVAERVGKTVQLVEGAFRDAKDGAGLDTFQRKAQGEG